MDKKTHPNWLAMLPAPLRDIVQAEAVRLGDGAPCTPDEWLVATLTTAWRSDRGITLKLKRKVKSDAVLFEALELPIGGAADFCFANVRPCRDRPSLRGRAATWR